MQVLTFFLEQELYAIDITLVDTIENKMPITPVPGSQKSILGLISNRGAVLPVINTSLVLNTETTKDLFEKLIIVNLENEKLALAVSEIDDVLDIEEEHIEKIGGDEALSVINMNSNIISLLTYKSLKNIN